MRRRKFGGDGGRDGGYKIGEDCNGDETFFSFFFVLLCVFFGIKIPSHVL